MNSTCEEYLSQINNYTLETGKQDDILSLIREIVSCVSNWIDDIPLQKEDLFFESKKKAELYYDSLYDYSVLLEKCIDILSANSTSNSYWNSTLLECIDISLTVEKKGYKDSSYWVKKKYDINGEVFVDKKSEVFESKNAEYHQKKYLYYQKLKSKYGYQEIERIDADISETKEKIRIYNDVFDSYLVSNPKMKDAFYGKLGKRFFAVFVVCMSLSFVSLFTLVSIGRENRTLLFVLGSILVLANVIGFVSKLVGHYFEKKEKEKRREIIAKLPDDMKNLYDENQKYQVKMNALLEERRRKKESRY